MSGQIKLSEKIRSSFRVCQGGLWSAVTSRSTSLNKSAPDNRRSHEGQNIIRKTFPQKDIISCSRSTCSVRPCEDQSLGTELHNKNDK